MLRTITRIILGLLLVSLTFLAVVPHRSFAEVNDDYALKISLENQLERKLKQVIMEITGTDRVVIFVNTELTSARGDSDKLMEKRKGNALVLPGVPEKKEIGSGQSEMLFGAGSSKYKVNKITLSIWIDNSVPGSIVDLIQDIAKNVIGYNQNRGDLINVKKVDFESKGFFSSLFALPNLFWLILTLVGGFMLVTVGMFFMDPLKKVVPALKNIDWGLIRGTGESNTVERTMTYEREILSGRTGASGNEPAALTGDKDAALPFSFIRERDIPSLAFLLKDKTAQDIAIAINYIDPAIGMRLLDQFPKDKQVEVALILGREEINMEKVNALEEMVKSRLTYVVGGENKLLALLDMTNEDVRDKIVKTLETKDAQTATRLKSRIKSLESIIRDLPAIGVQTLYRNIDATLFAQILKASPEDIQQKVITSLSAGAAERLKEEMELSRPLSGVRLRREKQNLMVLVRRLISEGLVEVENN
jgi:flagellar motor switch protein FliG